jgi:hypothetical protein
MTPANFQTGDRLDDIFAASIDTDIIHDVPEARNVSRPITLTPELQRAAEQGGFFERCRKCGGTGRFGNFGRCFACQGKGKLAFKTSPEARAKNCAGAADRKARRAEESVEAFKAAHPEIHAWMVEAAPTFGFAASMLDAVAKFGDLTERQLAACQRCVDGRRAKQDERKAREANAQAVDVSRIEKAFATARAKADRPGALGVRVRPLKLQAGDVTLSIQPGSAGSQWEGMLFVKSGDQKLGAVKGGRFTRRFGCSDAQEAAVLKACSDPGAAAIAFGKAWGRCAVCARELTNDGSIELGIGPICRDKFGW